MGLTLGKSDLVYLHKQRLDPARYAEMTTILAVQWVRRWTQQSVMETNYYPDLSPAVLTLDSG